MQTANSKLSELSNQANKIAVKEAERLAREVLIKNPDEATEFIMYAGRYNFIINERPGFVSGMTPDVKLKGYKAFHAFIEKWDKQFKITGNAMTFTAYGRKITDW